MTKHLLRLMAFCAAALIAGAQAQTSSGGSQGTTTGSSQDTTARESSSDSTGHFSATGRTSQNEIRASKLIGANVKGSTGEELGTINDIIVNPGSGRIDFAVISCTSSTSGNSSTTGNTTTGRGGARDHCKIN